MPKFSAFRHLHIIFQHHATGRTPAAAVYGRAGYITFHYFQIAVWTCGVYFLSMPECRTGRHLISPVPNEQKRRCPNQSGTGIRGPSLVPECSGTGLRYRMPECRCRRYRPRCRCPAMSTSTSALSIRNLLIIL